MASITLLRGRSIAGVPYSPADVLSTTFAIASQLVNAGHAYWTAVSVVAGLPDNPGKVTLLDAVTSLTGGAPTGLDGYLMANIAARRIFQVYISSELRTYLVVTVAGEVADGDSIISPPDYDSSGNNKFLVRIQ